MAHATTSLRDSLEDLWGCSVLDRDGDRIGSLEAVFYDSSDSEPEWLGIGVGLLGRKLVLVPAEGVASIGFAITLPLSTDVVRKAPELRNDDLDASTLHAASRYYASVQT
jgi:hypothetical protein